MLLRFQVSNFLSFWEAQELSFVASALKDSPNHFIQHARQRVLPAIGVYGANASGKSNLIAAMGFMVSEIVHSQTSRNAGDDIPRKRFLLSSESVNKPSDFNCDVVIDGVRYHYGFSVDDEKVIEEWLYAWPKGKRQIWFQRDVREKDVFYFGEHLKGHNRIIAELVRSDSLFLSAAAQLNHAQISKIYLFFKNGLHFDTDADGRGRQKITRDKANRIQGSANLMKFVLAADIGVTDIRIHPRQAEMDEWVRDLWSGNVEVDKSDERIQLLSSLKPFFDTVNEIGKRFEHQVSLDDQLMVQLGHAAGDETVYLKYKNESVGTRIFLSLILQIADVLERGELFVVDEIDSSMHPVLAARLIDLFNSPETNPNGAQLMFSTHDTNLLHRLRRDQVWFTEKDSRGATRLYPLTEYQTRRGDNLERGYLQGRFGAIPVLGSFQAVLADTGSGS